MPNSQATSAIPPIHFIGGIHGVGKTTFASAISEATHLVCHSAGALIKSHRDSTQDAAKQVRDVQQNQNLLLDAISSLELTVPLLLDGHFCLLTKDNSITEIPSDTYADLNLKSITVVIDTPMNIQRRLAQRDGLDYDPVLLERFQSGELAWAKEIGARLEIPVAAFSCDQVRQASEYIQGVINVPRP